jgi:hypothetical protein
MVQQQLLRAFHGWLKYIMFFAAARSANLIPAPRFRF